ncbi:hypothetical protein PpBr36_01579 [Pyricularia pennisetigena]|nr:hypothetical protein PpBr36_01579 [Pyricularia pennisetigena]TLS28415.1 hypothetical protein PpBr36_01579 [Pyricularia pennisetigena]
MFSQLCDFGCTKLGWGGRWEVAPDPACKAAPEGCG